MKRTDMAAPRLALARLSVAGCTPFPALVSNGSAQALDGWHGACDGSLQGSHSMDALLRAWSANGALLRAAELDPAVARPLADFRVHAPLVPRQVYCTIGNYREQLVEAALDAEPSLCAEEAQARRGAVLQTVEWRRREGAPYACVKPSAAAADPYTSLLMHPDERTLDWEVEIGVVIGRTAHRVPVERALEHVAGYCTVNDITLRERVFRADPKAMGTDFLQAKGGPGWLPIGPWLVPASHVADPQSLHLTLRLNGRTMQDGDACDMVFTIAEQIAYLSHHTRLEPGDLICTGSPAGFGIHHGRYLQPGDVVEAEVVGLGLQRLHLLSCETS
ncbi:fumarylacetoacetate hydrolase family protein [Azohydromonas australica]|uniref:fumarylacetoacetate hydrolase family protein n=1 Tax=Azohydromonas australica TaxID=364039 RepID=UPI00041618CD|nr:fumarylacetoacetate hydrolase family protein [Azohydromonas australica]